MPGRISAWRSPVRCDPAAWPRFRTRRPTVEPSRWTDAFERSLPRFVYFPFGAGPRYCIGQTFAAAEAALVLAAVCRRFSFAPDPTFNLELHPGITLRPRAGVRLMVRQIESSSSSAGTRRAAHAR